MADFGDRYVPNSSQGHGASAKRFRGALDALFARQIAQEEQSSTAVEEQSSGNGAGADDGAKPPVTPTKDPAAQRQDPSPVTAAKDPVDFAQWWEICTFGEGSKKLGVKARDEKLGSKKIPPKTILFEFKGGKLDELVGGREAKEGDVAFLFPKPRSTNVVDGGQVKLLVDVIRDHRVEALYMHAKFPKGAMPAVLAPKKTTYFLPDGPNSPLFALAAKATKLAELLWIVDSSACKVKPIGMALVSKRQLIVKEGITLEL